MAACWNGLLAQHLLEVDSSFSFCISKKTWIPTRKGMVTAGSLVDNEKLQIKKKTCLSIIKPTDKQIITKLIKTFDKPFYLQDAVDTLKLECNSMSLGHLLSKFHLNNYRFSDKVMVYLSKGKMRGFTKLIHKY